jgi:Glycosyl transferases group 1
VSHAPDGRVVCFATQGSGHHEEARILALLEDHAPVTWPFARAHKARSAIRLVRRGIHERPALVVMEGTGVAGGIAVLLLHRLGGIPFVVSSGDAVAPFLTSRHRWLRPFAAAYERLLYRSCAGFIGWTPYLCGRAIELGARHTTWAAGFADGPPEPGARDLLRARFGFGEDDIVFGIAGSLDWNDRVGYCYGLELVGAVMRVDRPDVKVLIVGDGSGAERLAALAGERLGDRVVLAGRVPRRDVVAHLAAMDVGSLPQSLDAAGALRYTTKLSEYVAAGLPVITGYLPLAYEFDDGWIVRLPGDRPWDATYVEHLSAFMAAASPSAVRALRAAVPRMPPVFDRDRQVHRVGTFLHDVIERRRRARATGHPLA